MKYTLSEAARLCGGRLEGPDREFDEVLTDSRHGIAPDSRPLFAALRGAGRDGHAFVGELYGRGVRAFLVNRPFPADEYPEAGFIIAPDTVASLQALAADRRARFRGIVAAVTGSCGKTVVKEWIAALAPAGFRLFRSPRSYNSQIGVPLSLLMMRGDEGAAVIEAGISRPGEMERLRDTIRPDIGIFTALGPQHDENFPCRAAKLDEKLSLFRGCRTVIFDGSDSHVKNRMEELFPLARKIDVSSRIADPAFRAAAPFADRESLADAALAEAFLLEAGCSPAGITAALGSLRPMDTQYQRTEGLYGSLLLRDEYDLDPLSLRPALDELSSAAPRRPLLVLTDPPAALPEETFRQAAALTADVETAGVGPQLSARAALFPESAVFYPSAAAMLASLPAERLRGRAVMVKGSSAEAERIASALARGTHTTVMEIDLDAVAFNLAAFRAAAGTGTRLMAMVKASAYGHGALETAAMLRRQGVDYLAVAFADEGAALREGGCDMPIVVLNADADSFGAMLAARLEPEIYSFASLERFAAEARRRGEENYPVHIKLDTGMHRLGFAESETGRLAERLAALTPPLSVRSVFSHLAAPDDPAADAYTRGQIAAFDRMSARLAAALPGRPLRHLAASSALVRFPQARYDMCRLGIGLYGYGPRPGTALRPAARLVTRIVQIHALSAGETVGYGRAEALRRDSRIATVPVGYADGLDRRLGCGRWSMLVNGRSAPTVGRICMDSCMFDVTDIPDAREGSPVSVFGPEPGHTAADMAAVLDTIPYEILTSVSPRVRRIYIKD